MGMAASQARLLALTSRMHDVELRAQNLESQKLSLATQKDAAYQKYCDALDAKKIQVGRTDFETGRMSYIDANFSTVCGFQENAGRQYSLVNNLTGRVIVTPEIKQLYEQYGNDSYTFAWAAMDFDGHGYSNQFGWVTGGPYSDNSFPNILHDQAGGAELVGIGGASNFGNMDEIMVEDDEGNQIYAGYGDDLYMTEVEFEVFRNHYGENQPLMQAYEALLQASQEGTLSERKAAFKVFRDALYSAYKNEILEAMNQNKNFYNPDFVENFDHNFDSTSNWQAIQNQFSYYQNLWEQIEQAGGCETIDEQYVSGDEGTEWFNNMVSAGLVSIYMLDSSSLDSGWTLTTVATSVGNNYLQEVNDEEKAKRAEAEYEHELDIINRKDTKFDTALKKLETEENACKTEIESIKKVKDENIDRTFNLFS